MLGKIYESKFKLVSSKSSCDTCAVIAGSPTCGRLGEHCGIDKCYVEMRPGVVVAPQGELEPCTVYSSIEFGMFEVIVKYGSQKRSPVDVDVNDGMLVCSHTEFVPVVKYKNCVVDEPFKLFSAESFGSSVFRSINRNRSGCLPCHGGRSSSATCNALPECNNQVVYVEVAQA